jgi:TonB family protein
MGRLVWPVVVLLALASPAAADLEPAGDRAPGEAAMQALLAALDGGVAADVVAALGAKVRLDGAVFADPACDKAFGGTRTVRGGKRIKLAECLLAAWQAKPSVSEPIVRVAVKGWTGTLQIGADHYVVALAAGKGGTARVAGITVNGGAPKPAKEKTVLLGVFKRGDHTSLDKYIDKNLSTSLGKFQGIKGTDTGVAMGRGTGTGVGDGVGTGTTRGKGTGAGGNAEGDFVTKGTIDTAGSQPSGGTGTAAVDVTVALGDTAGDLGGYTADEIQRVIKARTGVFRACYQRELNRTPGLAGKVVIDFTIGEDGTVTSAEVKSTTMNNDAVESCLVRQIRKLRFPAKGTRANVSYPFIFSNATP